VPGAPLFHLGDGHATQGCGEIDGTGIEISMDVTFTAWIDRRRAADSVALAPTTARGRWRPATPARSIRHCNTPRPN
jgi:acetamidase/formamidase